MKPKIYYDQPNHTIKVCLPHSINGRDFMKKIENISKPVKFKEGEATTPGQHAVNSLIMERASETANELTELECQIKGIGCWESEDPQEQHYTERAQDIYNGYYDEQMTYLYGLLNAQLKAISK